MLRVRVPSINDTSGRHEETPTHVGGQSRRRMRVEEQIHWRGHTPMGRIGFPSMYFRTWTLSPWQTHPDQPVERPATGYTTRSRAKPRRGPPHAAGTTHHTRPPETPAATPEGLARPEAVRNCPEHSLDLARSAPRTPRRRASPRPETAQDRTIDPEPTKVVRCSRNRKQASRQGGVPETR